MSTAFEPVDIRVTGDLLKIITGREGHVVNAWREFVQTAIDSRRWIPAELARRSGLTPQHISKILKDDRPRLSEMPDPATIAALAKGFNLSEDAVLLHAARGYGIPVDAPTIVTSVEGASDVELARELLRRAEERERPKLRSVARKPKRGGDNQQPL